MAEEKIKVAITGSEGFIGSCLMEKLSKNEAVEIVAFKGDLLIQEDLDQFFSQNRGIKQVIHLVGAFEGDLGKLFEINAHTTQMLLDTAVKNGVEKIIYSSSGAVYGEPLDGALHENTELKPNTLYGLSKKWAEDVILYCNRTFGLKYVILRFPNVYGGENGRGVINMMKKHIAESGKVPIFGDGTQSRNFLHVTDASQAIESSIFYEDSDIFNITNPKKVSINELAQILKKESGLDFEIEYKPAENKVKDLLLDGSKAKNKLGFEAKVTEIRL